MLAVLRELAAWREDTARALDWPRQRVAKDDALLELAAHAPTSIEDLKRSRLAKQLASERFASAVVAAAQTGMMVPEAEWPELPEYDPSNQGPRAVVELLRLLLKLKCEQEDVAPRLIATSEDIDAIAQKDDADVPAMHGWRRTLFGEDALKLKHGKLAVALSDGGKKIDIFQR